MTSASMTQTHLDRLLCSLVAPSGNRDVFLRPRPPLPSDRLMLEVVPSCEGPPPSASPSAASAHGHHHLCFRSVFHSFTSVPALDRLTVRRKLLYKSLSWSCPSNSSIGSPFATSIPPPPRTHARTIRLFCLALRSTHRYD